MKMANRIFLRVIVANFHVKGLMHLMLFNHHNPRIIVQRMHASGIIINLKRILLREPCMDIINKILGILYKGIILFIS